MGARSQAGDPGRSANSARAGYVLIEVVAALALTILLLGFAFPYLARTTTTMGMRALLAETLAALRDARTAAVATARPTSVVFDAERRELQAGRQSVTIPADVEFALTAGGNCPASESGIGIVFRADGTNCGGVLRFASGGRRWRARLNWVDGHVDVSDGQ